MVPVATTTQVLTADGAVWDCDHAGAQEEEIDFVVNTYSEGVATPDDSRTETVLRCDAENCRAWQDEDGTWRYDG